MLLNELFYFPLPRFFCDGATEKTVTLTLLDKFGTTRQEKTRQVSCQYPIVAISDLSQDHADNTNENPWEVTQEFPNATMVAAGAAKTYQVRKGKFTNMLLIRMLLLLLLLLLHLLHLLHLFWCRFLLLLLL